MLTLAAPCSRCMQPKSVHQVVYASEPLQQGGGADREVVIQCTHCTKHAIAIVHAIAHLPLAGTQCPLTGDISHPRNSMRLVAIIPEMPVNRAPEHVPEPVARAFVDGLDVLEHSKWTAAAGCFRTAIDRATKVLWGQPNDGAKAPNNLAARIDALGPRIGIPQSIIEWAHSIRGVGNEIHDMEEVQPDDAMDAANFTEMFLTYTFTLPKQVMDFRSRRAS
jgi:hypothetical protein